MIYINNNWGLDRLGFELKEAKNLNNKLTEYGKVMFSIERKIKLLKLAIRNKKARES